MSKAHAVLLAQARVRPDGRPKALRPPELSPHDELLLRGDGYRHRREAISRELFSDDDETYLIFKINAASEVSRCFNELAPNKKGQSLGCCQSELYYSSLALSIQNSIASRKTAVIRRGFVPRALYDTSQACPIILTLYELHICYGRWQVSPIDSAATVS